MARPCLSFSAFLSPLLPKPSHLRRAPLLRISHTRLSSTYSGMTELSEPVLAESSLHTPASQNPFDPIKRSRARTKQLPPSRYHPSRIHLSLLQFVTL